MAVEWKREMKMEGRVNNWRWEMEKVLQEDGRGGGGGPADGERSGEGRWR